MIRNSYPKPYVVFIAKPSTYATCYLIEFCQIVVIKITYTFSPHAMLLH